MSLWHKAARIALETFEVPALVRGKLGELIEKYDRLGAKPGEVTLVLGWMRPEGQPRFMHRQERGLGSNQPWCIEVRAIQLGPATAPLFLAVFGGELERVRVRSFGGLAEVVKILPMGRFALGEKLPQGDESLVVEGVANG